MRQRTQERGKVLLVIVRLDPCILGQVFSLIQKEKQPRKLLERERGHSNYKEEVHIGTVWE